MTTTDHIAAYFDQLVAQHGSDLRALDYGRPESQQTRFRALAAVTDLTGKRVLDVGCGFAHLADFLDARFVDVRYTGIDLSPAVLDVARRRRPDLDLRLVDLMALPDERAFDVVFANGIFYLLGDDAPTKMRAMISRLYALAHEAVAFCSLSTWAPLKVEGEFHADPNEMLAYCRSLTPWVNLRHAHLPHDFTIYLYREQQP